MYQLGSMVQLHNVEARLTVHCMLVACLPLVFPQALAQLFIPSTLPVLQSSSPPLGEEESTCFANVITLDTAQSAALGSWH